MKTASIPATDATELKTEFPARAQDRHQGAFSHPPGQSRYGCGNPQPANCHPQKLGRIQENLRHVEAAR